MTNRTKGLLNISANFEPQVAEPFDGRLRVKTKDSLISSTTWQSSDGNVYTYNGMIVSVYDDSEINNGIYRLKTDDYSIESNWEKISGSSVVKQDYIYYVDGTTGSDSNNGLTWGTAKKTFGFLRPNSSEVPRIIIGNLIINIRGVICSTDTIWNLPLKSFIVSGGIYIIGEMSDVSVGLSVDNYENNTSNILHHSFITTTGSGWTPGEHKGYFIKITSGTGLGDTYYPILDNTADTLESISLPDLSGTSVYSIVAPSEIRGALTSDPSTLVAYIDEFVEEQDNNASHLEFKNILITSDDTLTPSNWLRIGSRSSVSQTNWVNCSINTRFQQIESGGHYFDRCWVNLNNYRNITSSGSGGIGWFTISNSAVYGSGKTGGGLWYYGSPLSVFSTRFKDQDISVGYYGSTNVEINSCFFDTCNVSLNVSGTSVWIDGQNRFKDNLVGFYISAGTLVVSDGFEALTDSVTSEIKIDESSSYSFSDIGVKNISNAVMGSFLVIYELSTGLIKLQDEYDNTITGLSAYNFQDAIDQLYLNIHDPVTLNQTAIDGGLSLNDQEISFRAATSLLDGYLKSSDWNTFNNKSNYVDPLTTPGDILYVNSLNETDRLGLGVDGYVLSSDGNNVIWKELVGGGTLNTAYDFGGPGVGREIDADSGAVQINVPDNSDNYGLIINQNDITNDPSALVINNYGWGNCIELNSSNNNSIISSNNSLNISSYGDNFDINLSSSNSGNLYLWVQSDESSSLQMESNGILNSSVEVSSFSDGAISKIDIKSNGSEQSYINLEALDRSLSGEAFIKLSARNTGGGDSYIEIGSEYTKNLFLIDSNLTSSDWAGSDFELSSSTSEWNSFISNFGKVSLINAINQIVKIYEVIGINIGTEVIDSFSDLDGNAVFWDYVIIKDDNLRAGTVTACWNGNTDNVVYTEYSTTDVGDTSDVSFFVDVETNNIRLLAIVASDDWKVKVSRKIL